MHVVGRSLSLDTELAAHKLSVVPHTRSLFLTLAVAMALVGCDDREPAPRSPVPQPPAAAPSTSAAVATGWPAGLGRALVVRLTSSDESYRLVVPELGDRRYADSAISVKTGDSIAVTLLGRSGKAGAARLRIVDAEVGAGSCVTWPAAEITGAAYLRPVNAADWRVAAERDSVTPVVVDSLMGMRAGDSLSLVGAIDSLLSSATAASDTALRGIPFGIRTAYSFRPAGVHMIAGELVRTSRAEADQREERLFVVGEREGGAAPVDRLVYSRRVSGRADSGAVTELLVVVVARQSGRPVIALSVEDASGLRLQLLERTGSRRWRLSWSSVVSFC